MELRTRGPGQSPLLLLDAAAVLRSLGIDYMVIGAMAASFHGMPRASLDADALIPPTDSLEHLKAACQRVGFRTEIRRGAADDPVSAVVALEDAFGNRVDLLTGIRGLDPASFSRALEADFEGEKIRLVGLEDFISMKIFAGGAKDLEDARQAMAASRNSLDVGLLRKLTVRFGKEEAKVLEGLLDELKDS